MGEIQRRLFDTAPWEEDDQAERLVATVVFPEAPSGKFDYWIPDRLLGAVEAGRRVRVPLGRADRPVVGYCVAVGPKPLTDRPLKPVAAVIDRQTLLSPAMLRLTEWMADYYLCEWGQVLEAVVPAGVRIQAGTHLENLYTVDPRVADQRDQLNLPPAQARIIQALLDVGRPLRRDELLRLARCSPGPVSALQRKGLVRVSARRTPADRPLPAPVARQPRHVLNPDQQKALDTILAAVRAHQPQTILVHGVTGSGKTEVYIRAIEEVVALGRQAILLVPEISLTPQTVERFRARFDRVAVLHSHLGDAERHHQWRAIAEGRVQVVVGARSAIFAPTPHLGLIVLDEEHETTFKQDTTPRYHARTVALARANDHQVPLVLGSATPSLESWYEAQMGTYRLVTLPARVFDRPMPEVGTIDLRLDEHARTSRGAISRLLHQAMREALDAGGQVILLLNRRGFATHIQCPACGHVVRCPHCEIALTHHRAEEQALCHYCDYHMPTPTFCPKCRFAGIRFGGLGTQRLEAEVKARFPGVPALRMDTDSMQRAGSHERALGAFRSGQIRILLGTQMIAKGLDFPNVTLVGVINADTALHLPDFRAAERTFHLVTQVAGRSGRGEKGGRVLVQTFSPDHPAIAAAVHHDYAAFAASELPIRQMFGYPPFASMIRLLVRGPMESSVREYAEQLGQRLRTVLQTGSSSARVLGPAPAPFPKLRGMYRWHLQVQGPTSEPLRHAVREATRLLRPTEAVQYTVDVDPFDML